MNAVQIREPGLDLPILAADALVDTGLFDFLVNGIGRALAAIPRTVVDWLGPEVRTPGNSSPPTLTFAEVGFWNGVVFVECSEPAYWVLARASAGKRSPPTGQPLHFGAREPFGQPSRPSPHSPFSATRWPEDQPPLEREPWDRDPWAR